MKRFLAVITLIFLLAVPALALSDAEFIRMKKNNADFARADRRLSQVWNRLRKELPKRVLNVLRDEQRDWVEYGRDEDAKAYMEEGYSRVEAYTMATSDRADYLPRRAREITRGR